MDIGLKTNAKELPRVLYGLHMCEGVAEYSEPQVNEGQPYRILILEDALKQMDTTFSGKPVYVRHVDGVNLDKLQEEAAGYVSESFYNPNDGKHWAKFIVVSDAGHEAIRLGWKLSNAYLPKQYGGSGRWHNVDYSKEVMQGEYEHLAIVPNPRYEESVIMTPEEFKKYNSDKEMELKRLANSKENKSMFNFFTKSKLENAEQIENASVVLKNGRELTVKQLINEAEEKEMKKDEEKPADKAAEKKEEKKEEPAKNDEKAEHKINMEAKVKVGDDEMSVNELIAKHQEMKAKLDAMDTEKKEKKDSDEEEDDDMGDEEAKKKALELAEHEDKEIKEEDKKKNQKNFNSLKHAHLESQEDAVIELSEDRLARGKSRYGSGK